MFVFGGPRRLRCFQLTRAMARKSDIPSVYYGEPHKFDPKFRGPVHNRTRTDVLCCVVFFIFILGYVLLGVLAWVNGDPKKIVYPTDSFGNICGDKQNLNKPFLFYINMLKCASIETVFNFECPTFRVCVEKCPDKYEKLSQARLDPEKWKIYKQYCKPGIDDRKPYTTLIANDDCPATLHPSKPLLRRCVLVLNITGPELMVNLTRKESADLSVNLVEDLANSWQWILLCLVCAMVVSFFLLLMMRLIVGVLVWFFLFALLCALSYGIIYCFLKYRNLSETEGGNITISEMGFRTDANVYLDLSQTWFIFMIVMSVIEGILLIVLIFLRQRLVIAIVLLKESSRAIRYIMSALIFPVFTFLLLCISIAYGSVVAIFLATSGVPVYKILPVEGCVLENDTCDPQTFDESSMTGKCSGSMCFFSHYGGESFFHRYTFVFQLYNVFMFLWLVNFVIALGQCTLAGAFASYYWALRKPKDIPARPIISSFNRAIHYHTGSLALGALILSSVQMIRLVLEYLDKKLNGSQTACARFLINCLKYCFWCLERFLKFINRNAYIMIAIYGKSFCTSSKNAFFLLLRNIIRVAVLDKVTDFLLLLAKLVVTASIGAFAYFFFSHQISHEAPILYSYWVPVVVVALGSFLIASGFFSVYSMCVDTLFLCFCEDLERNDGSEARPYYMSPELRKILHKENEAESRASEYESQ
ncbi:choline transporter-like protein 5 isoform X1 [Stigmatopora argus]